MAHTQLSLNRQPTISKSQEALLNQGRRDLEESDNRKFGWFHIKTALVAGIGFFADAYDVFIINLVVTIIGYVYFADSNNVVPANVDLGIKVSAAVGTFVGQLLFGYLGDAFGRKKMYAVSLAIIIFSTVSSTMCASAVRGLPVWGSLIFWRLLLGFGIGGDYPLSATITSEHSSTKTRGAMLAAVFASQGFGILGASMVSAAVLAAFRTSIEADIFILDYVWRLCIGFGVVPAVVSIYFRATMPETPRYKMEKLAKAARAANGEKEEKASWTDFFRFFSTWRHLKILLGTSVAWFALDVAFYGINLNNAIILRAIGFADGGTPYEQLFKNATGNIIIAMLGTVPGYWFTVFLVDRMGRKRIQLMGFGILTVLFIILGAAYHAILNTSIELFVVIFTLAQFFQNFGPNTTTFIIPGEVFPTKYRSTAHGFSAASGKLGAIIAQVGFSQMKDIGGHNAFVDKLLLIFAAFMFIGFVFTLLIPETAGKSLEEINREYDLEKPGVV